MTVELEQLLTRCRPQLSRILFRYRIPAQDAEDLLQETFLILVTKWESIHAPEAWLAGTLRNRCIIYWRRQRTRLVDLMDDAMLEVLAHAEPPPQEHTEIRCDLGEALSRLPPRSRSMLRLRYAYGCTSREAGERMGYEASSVRKMTQRCLTRLTRELGPEAGLPALETRSA